MVRRLVVDVLRRARLMYLGIFPIVLTLWGIVAAGENPVAWGLAMSLMLAYAMGTLAAISAINLRELRVLPVTSRELWMATFATSTLVMPVFLLVVQVLAVAGVQVVTGSTNVSSETLFLSAVYAFAYSGAMLPVGPLLGYASHKSGSGRFRWVWIALTPLCLLILMGGLGFPWLFAASLPLALNQFTLPAIVALVACLAITACAWVWTPGRVGVVRHNQAAHHVRSSTAANFLGRFGDRFTGIARIAWSHASITIVATAAVLLCFVGYWAVFGSGMELDVFMRHTGLLPFETSFQPDPDQLDGMVLLFAFILVVGNGVWNPMARQLKVLPLTVREINGLFLVTPLVTWTLVWTVLVIGDLAATGTFPRTLRLDVLVFAAGTTAVGQMLSLRFKRSGGFPWFFMPLGIATAILTKTIGSSTTSASVAIVVVGLVSFGFAAFVNHRTLTRSTSSANAYQRQQIPLGFTGPGARR